jgi:hypothetical protein
MWLNGICSVGKVIKLIVWGRADRPMVCVPEMACAFYCCSMFFISFGWPAFLYCEEYVYVHLSDCLDIVYELPLLPNNTVSETFLHKLGAVGNIDWIVYHWGAGLVVTGRIRDIGQNISHSSFWTGSNSSHSYFHVFLLIAFLSEVFNRNIIVLCIHDIINI